METRFRTTLKLAHINSWEWDLESNFLHLVNAADREEMARISPLMAAETVTIPNYPDVLFEKNMVSSENAYLVRKYEKLIKEAKYGEEVSFRLPFLTKDGDTIWLQFFGIVYNHRAIGYYTDITKQIEIAKKNYGFDAIHEAYDTFYSEVLLGLSADYSNVFWIDLDTEEFRPIRLDSISQKMIGNVIEKLSSYKQVVSFYIDHFVYPDDRDLMKFLLDPDKISEILNNQDIYTRDYRSERFGEIVFCQVKVAKGNSKNRRTITIGFKNIDQQYRTRLEANYDSLTGLFNRNAFLKYMNGKIKEHPDKFFNILISDIENFKHINDVYGEKVADDVLKHVGKHLAGLSDSLPGTIFARYSGDQFIGLFMSDIDLSKIGFNVMEGFSQSLEDMYTNSPIGHFDVKFGMYLNIDRSLSSGMICDRALMAVRSIKHKYNVSFALYDNHMEQSYQKELRILENMEEALNTNQFKVYYQPKHDCISGKLIGAEALVRWEHPEFGFMSPADFIPLFEKNGFITNLDFYMFKQVYKDLMSIHNLGLPIVPVSINASRLDLLNPRFIDSILGFMKENHIDPSWFHIEVTEGIFMDNEKLLYPVLNQLKEIGIQIELDDFGSGYSSLSILNSLPLDIIKLDMGLIRNIKEHIHVVDASIRLAHVLGFKTTAEGVESIETINILRSMGCDYIQGYYYSKPIPINGYVNYIKSNL